MTAAIVGVGYSPFTRASGRSVLSQAVEACGAAIADAGLTADQVDGIASFSVLNDSVPAVSVGTVLGVRNLSYALDLQMGGQAPCYLIGLAASAITSGMANYVLVYRALNGRSGARVGGMPFPGPGAAYREAVGYTSYAMYVAMWAQRFLYETGQSAEDLLAVALAQRAYAQKNERAIQRRGLTPDDYWDSSYVVEPFRPADCTSEIDGACAVLVTTAERARDLPNPPVAVRSVAYRAGHGAGLDIADHLEWRDYTRNYTSWLRDDLYARARISADELQFAEIYDCFTSTALMGLEGLGITGRGESGAFVADGQTAPGGRLPTNTNGGLLSEGYLHGMNTVAEAVLQVQGRCGVRQLDRNEVCVVTSGALMDGSAMILTAT